MLLLLITFTSLSYSDYQIWIPSCHFRFIVNFIFKNNAVIITFFKFSTMRKSTVFVFILLHNAYAKDSVESCPKITSTEVRIKQKSYKCDNQLITWLTSITRPAGSCNLVTLKTNFAKYKNFVWSWSNTTYMYKCFYAQIDTNLVHKRHG